MMEFLQIYGQIYQQICRACSNIQERRNVEVTPEDPSPEKSKTEASQSWIGRLFNQSKEKESTIEVTPEVQKEIPIVDAPTTDENGNNSLDIDEIVETFRDSFDSTLNRPNNESYYVKKMVAAWEEKCVSENSLQISSSSSSSSQSMKSQKDTNSINPNELAAKKMSSSSSSSSLVGTELTSSYGQWWKKMSIGRNKFNVDPKKGIEYLIEQNLISATAEDVAQFLYTSKGLKKTAIGEYLGEKHDFNESVLQAFVELHDFTDLILVQALRQFLWSFRLPGEAQKIDRMMECFAQRYCQLNPNIFTHTDACYILCFAIIMLNTSLHNPSVKEKLSVEQFVSMNRGIDDGKDLPRELIESLYESIKTEPFKIPEDDRDDLMHTFFNPDKEGWLWKQSGTYKSWKRRWFIINDNCLYYFKHTTDKAPRGIIPLENIQVREVQDRKKPRCFELCAPGSKFVKACKTDSEGHVVKGKRTVYRMSAATEEEEDKWIKVFRQSISQDPFYDMVAAEKKKVKEQKVHLKS